MSERERAEKTWAWWFAILGALVAGPSAISIVQRELEIGLAPFFGRLVEFYRSSVLALADAAQLREWPLLNELDANTFAMMLEVLPISLVGTGTIIRAYSILGLNWAYLMSGVIMFAMPFAFIAVGTSPAIALALVPLAGAAELFFTLALRPGTFRDVLREASLSLIATSAITAAAVVAFYVGNLLAGQ